VGPIVVTVGCSAPPGPVAEPPARSDEEASPDAGEIANPPPRPEIDAGPPPVGTGNPPSPRVAVVARDQRGDEWYLTIPRGSDDGLDKRWTAQLLDAAGKPLADERFPIIRLRPGDASVRVVRLPDSVVRRVTQVRLTSGE
jgi:hypothetical protein